MNFFVYALFDNKNNMPIYVGATRNIEERFVGHRNTTIKNHPNKEFVTIEVLEECVSDSEVMKMEQYWFWQFKSWGFLEGKDKCHPYKVKAGLGYSCHEIGVLADVFGKSLLTIQRWIKSNSDYLTSDKAISALRNIR